MKYLKQLLLAYFRAGLDDNNPDETYRRKYVVNLFSFVGMSITFLMATNAAFIGNWLLSSILYIASAVYLIGFYMQKKTSNVDLSSNIILYSLTALMIYLIYSGGTNNTGPLWIFMVAPVALFLHGLKRGLVDLSIFLIIICTLLFFPDGQLLATSYDPDFKTRLIYSFLTVTFLSSFYEYSREKSHKSTLEISKEFERLANYDPLTKLSNRRDALSKLDYEYHRMLRTNQPLTVLLCDIDHFKAINDTHGHDAGDQVLIKLAELFKTQIRAQDTVARWGGEEFLFILPQTDIAHADTFSEKIHAAIRKCEVPYQNQSISCTTSIGMCQIEENTSINQALHRADEALYEAKAQGRNQTAPKVA
ncbi:GGDEF domain-containing protein [Thalassotalea sp. M1531]|uniref:diguanylate cyclase n=1 Tax=Thalassotalea algicola TaxID=2716224 RepID=A0A7Y0LCV1_9GAMM|nr:GGDEF domain-containing protein [Thalassotalea algicola]NMP31767.1 GGDEF domain-containing protein [Thalassotalea algicola]